VLGLLALTHFMQMTTVTQVCRANKLKYDRVVRLSRAKAVFSSFKIPKILQDSPSHQIFGRMYRTLNVGKNNN
jgi:hypothetical protein